MGVPMELRDLSDPYDRGYWLRYDGKPRPRDKKRRDGWDACHAELAFEAGKSIGGR